MDDVLCCTVVIYVTVQIHTHTNHHNSKRKKIKIQASFQAISLECFLHPAEAKRLGCRLLIALLLLRRSGAAMTGQRGASSLAQPPLPAKSLWLVAPLVV